MSWPVVKLGDVAERVDYGLTASAKEDNEGPRFLRITDMQDDAVDWSTVPSCECSEKEFKENELSVGDIVFARTGATTGKSFLIRHLPRPSVFASYLIRVRPTDEVDSKYLAYFFKSPQYWFQITAMAEGAAQPGVNSSKLKELEIPLPPLPEQKRIAAILDKADAIRRKRQQAIQLADDFLRAVFLDMFGDPVTNPKGWPVDKFGNVFDVRDGTHDSPSYVSSGFPLITSKNIKNGEIDMLDVNYISKEDYELINRRSKVDVGDILMPMIGTIGNPAIVRDEPLFAIKNVALIKLGRSSLPAEFVLALLNGPLLEAAVQQKSRGGTQKFLGLGDIRDLNCYLPDERLVSKYIGIANKVRQFASAYRKADEAGLEGSLSQKAFSGHL